MTDYALVLTRKFPGRQWTLNNNDYASLTILDDGPKPTKKTLDDLWVQVQHDVEWDRVRAERDRRLAACDWTQVADAPVDAAAWAVYRQELRDIPQNWNDPELVEWPEEP